MRVAQAAVAAAAKVVKCSQKLGIKMASLMRGLMSKIILRMITSWDPPARGPTARKKTAMSWRGPSFPTTLTTRQISKKIFHRHFMSATTRYLVLLVSRANFYVLTETTKHLLTDTGFFY